MKILAIESSCDDTSVTLLEADEQKIQPIEEKTASQIEVHKKYGGVVPEIAGRKHAEKIVPTIEAVMEDHEEPDAIAVTAGPGLMTGLLVGVEAARTLSYLWNVPVVPVNHIEGHIYSVKIQGEKEFNNEKFEFPVLSLVVSGGHTEIILIEEHGKYKKIGGTRDDAAGEAFDKVAKMLDLDYPGGPKISKLATEGDRGAINFPRPMINSGNYDFSFSGIKTSAMYWLKDNDLASMRPTGNDFSHKSAFEEINGDPDIITRYDFCASFEQAIIDVLVEKTINAVEEYKPKTLIVSGGVSANKKLRSNLSEKLTQLKNKNRPNKTLHPLQKYCMDNATMIGIAGYYHAKNKDFTPWQKLDANPNWKIY